MKRDHKTIKSIIILSGSFTFAFLLAEGIHELGHFLLHQVFGTRGIGIHLDPFGGSRIMGVRSLPPHAILPTTAAGPLLNLAGGLMVFFLLGRKRNPGLLPFLMWGPVALVQEGVNMSLGLLSYGSDAFWLAEQGIPPAFLIMLGLLFLGAGVLLVSLILSRIGINPAEGFLKRFGILFSGISLLMFVRAAYSLIRGGGEMLENIIPLAFTFILAIIAAAIQRPAVKLFPQGSADHDSPLAWTPTLTALALGLGAFLLSYFFLGRPA